MLRNSAPVFLIEIEQLTNIFDVTINTRADEINYFWHCVAFIFM